MEITLLHGDCLERMKEIPDASIDFILTDPPYGTTNGKWDSVIPFEPIWQQLERVIKPNGAIALFGTEPFSTMLRMSNIKNYKYDYVWLKSRANGFQHAKNKPLSITENISVFSKANIGHEAILKEKRMIYIPQGIRENGIKEVTPNKHGSLLCTRDKQTGRKYESHTGYPTNLLQFPSLCVKKLLHPTQKPVELLEFLIKTYSQSGETVLDFAAGSFSTAIACMNTDRNFIGIEIDDKYFEAGKKRVQENNTLFSQFELKGD